jgi:hypothetical protein
MIDGNLASVKDLANKDLWTFFPPKSQGGAAYIGDAHGSIIGRTNADYKFDLREVGTVSKGVTVSASPSQQRGAISQAIGRWTRRRTTTVLFVIKKERRG